MHLEYLRPSAAMMWTVPGAGRGRQIRIVVEELPDGTWDWTVWETGRPEASFGVRATAAGAVADAAVAASAIDLAGTAIAGRGGDRITPFATVEKTPHGPTLFVGGIRVQAWFSNNYDSDTGMMATEINRALSAKRAPGG